MRYGVGKTTAPDLQALYCSTRDAGLGAEVKRRILMGSYALSSGYYEAYYKRAQQVSGVHGIHLQPAVFPFPFSFVECVIP